MQFQMKSSELEMVGDFTGFSDSKRLRFSVDEFSGVLLSDMLELGTDLYGSIREAKAVVLRHAEKTRSNAEILGCRLSWVSRCAFTLAVLLHIRRVAT